MKKNCRNIKVLVATLTLSVLSCLAHQTELKASEIRHHDNFDNFNRFDGARFQPNAALAQRLVDAFDFDSDAFDFDYDLGFNKSRSTTEAPFNSSTTEIDEKQQAVVKEILFNLIKHEPFLAEKFRNMLGVNEHINQLTADNLVSFVEAIVADLSLQAPFSANAANVLNYLNSLEQVRSNGDFEALNYVNTTQVERSKRALVFDNTLYEKLHKTTNLLKNLARPQSLVSARFIKTDVKNKGYDFAHIKASCENYLKTMARFDKVTARYSDVYFNFAKRAIVDRLNKLCADIADFNAGGGALYEGAKWSVAKFKKADAKCRSFCSYVKDLNSADEFENDARMNQLIDAFLSYEFFLQSVVSIANTLLTPMADLKGGELSAGTNFADFAKKFADKNAKTGNAQTLLDADVYSYLLNANMPLTNDKLKKAESAKVKNFVARESAIGVYDKIQDGDGKKMPKQVNAGKPYVEGGGALELEEDIPGSIANNNLVYTQLEDYFKSEPFKQAYKVAEIKKLASEVAGYLKEYKNLKSQITLNDLANLGTIGDIAKLALMFNRMSGENGELDELKKSIIAQAEGNAKIREVFGNISNLIDKGIEINELKKLLNELKDLLQGNQMQEVQQGYSNLPFLYFKTISDAVTGEKRVEYAKEVNFQSDLKQGDVEHPGVKYENGAPANSSLERLIFKLAAVLRTKMETDQTEQEISDKYDRLMDYFDKARKENPPVYKLSDGYFEALKASKPFFVKLAKVIDYFDLGKADTAQAHKDWDKAVANIFKEVLMDDEEHEKWRAFLSVGFGKDWKDIVAEDENAFLPMEDVAFSSFKLDGKEVLEYSAADALGKFLESVSELRSCLSSYFIVANGDNVQEEHNKITEEIGRLEEFKHRHYENLQDHNNELEEIKNSLNELSQENQQIVDVKRMKELYNQEPGYADKVSKNMAKEIRAFFSGTAFENIELSGDQYTKSIKEKVGYKTKNLAGQDFYRAYSWFPEFENLRTKRGGGIFGGDQYYSDFPNDGAADQNLNSGALTAPQGESLQKVSADASLQYLKMNGSVFALHQGIYDRIKKGKLYYLPSGVANNANPIKFPEENGEFYMAFFAIMRSLCTNGLETTDQQISLNYRKILRWILGLSKEDIEGVKIDTGFAYDALLKSEPFFVAIAKAYRKYLQDLNDARKNMLAMPESTFNLIRSYIKEVLSDDLFFELFQTGALDFVKYQKNKNDYGKDKEKIKFDELIKLPEDFENSNKSFDLTGGIKTTTDAEDNNIGRIDLKNFSKKDYLIAMGTNLNLQFKDNCKNILQDFVAAVKFFYEKLDNILDLDEAIARRNEDLAKAKAVDDAKNKVDENFDKSKKDGFSLKFSTDEPKTEDELKTLGEDKAKFMETNLIKIEQQQQGDQQTKKYGGWAYLPGFYSELRYSDNNKMPSANIFNSDFDNPGDFKTLMDTIDKQGGIKEHDLSTVKMQGSKYAFLKALTKGVEIEIDKNELAFNPKDNWKSKFKVVKNDNDAEVIKDIHKSSVAYLQNLFKVINSTLTDTTSTEFDALRNDFEKNYRRLMTLLRLVVGALEKDERGKNHLKNEGEDWSSWISALEHAKTFFGILASSIKYFDTDAADVRAWKDWQEHIDSEFDRSYYDLHLLRSFDFFALQNGKYFEDVFNIDWNFLNSEEAAQIKVKFDEDVEGVASKGDEKTLKDLFALKFNKKIVHDQIEAGDNKQDYGVSLEEIMKDFLSAVKFFRDYFLRRGGKNVNLEFIDNKIKGQGMIEERDKMAKQIETLQKERDNIKQSIKLGEGITDAIVLNKMGSKSLAAEFDGLKIEGNKFPKQADAAKPFIAQVGSNEQAINQKKEVIKQKFERFDYIRTLLGDGLGDVADDLLSEFVDSKMDGVKNAANENKAEINNIEGLDLNDRIKANLKSKFDEIKNDIPEGDGSELEVLKREKNTVTEFINRIDAGGDVDEQDENVEKIANISRQIQLELGELLKADALEGIKNVLANKTEAGMNTAKEVFVSSRKELFDNDNSKYNIALNNLSESVKTDFNSAYAAKNLADNASVKEKLEIIVEISKNLSDKLGAGKLQAKADIETKFKDLLLKINELPPGVLKTYVWSLLTQKHVQNEEWLAGLAGDDVDVRVDNAIGAFEYIATNIGNMDVFAELKRQVSDKVNQLRFFRDGNRTLIQNYLNGANWTSSNSIKALKNCILNQKDALVKEDAPVIEKGYSNLPFLYFKTIKDSGPTLIAPHLKRTVNVEGEFYEEYIKLTEEQLRNKEWMEAHKANIVDYKCTEDTEGPKQSLRYVQSGEFESALKTDASVQKYSASELADHTLEDNIFKLASVLRTKMDTTQTVGQMNQKFDCLIAYLEKMQRYEETRGHDFIDKGFVEALKEAKPVFLRLAKVIDEFNLSNPDKEGEHRQWDQRVANIFSSLLWNAIGGLHLGTAECRKFITYKVEEKDIYNKLCRINANGFSFNAGGEINPEAEFSSFKLGDKEVLKLNNEQAIRTFIEAVRFFRIALIDAAEIRQQEAVPEEPNAEGVADPSVNINRIKNMLKDAKKGEYTQDQKNAFLKDAVFGNAENNYAPAKQTGLAAFRTFFIGENTKLNDDPQYDEAGGYYSKVNGDDVLFSPAFMVNLLQLKRKDEEAHQLLNEFVTSDSHEYFIQNLTTDDDFKKLAGIKWDTNVNKMKMGGSKFGILYKVFITINNLKSKPNMKLQYESGGNVYVDVPKESMDFFMAMFRLFLSLRRNFVDVSVNNAAADFEDIMNLLEDMAAGSNRLNVGENQANQIVIDAKYIEVLRKAKPFFMILSKGFDKFLENGFDWKGNGFSTIFEELENNFIKFALDGVFDFANYKPEESFDKLIKFPSGDPFRKNIKKFRVAKFDHSKEISLAELAQQQIDYTIVAGQQAHPAWKFQRDVLLNLATFVNAVKYFRDKMKAFSQIKDEVKNKKSVVDRKIADRDGNILYLNSVFDKNLKRDFLYLFSTDAPVRVADIDNDLKYKEKGLQLEIDSKNNDARSYAGYAYLPAFYEDLFTVKPQGEDVEFKYEDPAVSQKWMNLKEFPSMKKVKEFFLHDVEFERLKRKELKKYIEKDNLDLSNARMAGSKYIFLKVLAMRLEKNKRLYVRFKKKVAGPNAGENQTYWVGGELGNDPRKGDYIVALFNVIRALRTKPNVNADKGDIGAQYDYLMKFLEDYSKSVENSVSAELLKLLKRAKPFFVIIAKSFDEFKLEKGTVEDWNVWQKSLKKELEKNYEELYVDGAFDFVAYKKGQNLSDEDLKFNFNDDLTQIKFYRFSNGFIHFADTRTPKRTANFRRPLKVLGNPNDERNYHEFYDDIVSGFAKAVHFFRKMLADVVDGNAERVDANLEGPIRQLKDNKDKFIEYNRNVNLRNKFIQYNQDLPKITKFIGEDLWKNLGSRSLASEFDGLYTQDGEPLPKQSDADKDFFGAAAVVPKPAKLEESGYGNSGFLYFLALDKLTNPVYAEDVSIPADENPLINKAIIKTAGTPVSHELETAVLKFAKAVKNTTKNGEDTNLIRANVIQVFKDILALHSYSGNKLIKDGRIGGNLEDIGDKVEQGLAFLVNTIGSFDFSKEDYTAQTSWTERVGQVLEYCITNHNFIKFLLINPSEKFIDWFDLNEIERVIKAVKERGGAGLVLGLGGVNLVNGTRSLLVDDEGHTINFDLAEVYKGFIEALSWLRDVCSRVLQSIDLKSALEEDVSEYFFNEENKQKDVIKVYNDQLKSADASKLQEDLNRIEPGLCKSELLYDNDFNAFSGDITEFSANNKYVNADPFMTYVYGGKYNNAGSNMEFSTQKPLFGSEKDLQKVIGKVADDLNVPTPYTTDSLDRDIFFQAMNWLAIKNSTTNPGLFKTTTELKQIFEDNKAKNISVKVADSTGALFDEKISVLDFYRGETKLDEASGTKMLSLVGSSANKADSIKKSVDKAVKARSVERRKAKGNGAALTDLENSFNSYHRSVANRKRSRADREAQYKKNWNKLVKDSRQVDEAIRQIIDLNKRIDADTHAAWSIAEQKEAEGHAYLNLLEQKLGELEAKTQERKQKLDSNQFLDKLYGDLDKIFDDKADGLDELFGESASEEVYQ